MLEIDRFDMYNRVMTKSDWVLYVHDYYWVLVMDGYYEFYYNPLLYLGKIKVQNMPDEAVHRMNRSCRIYVPADRDRSKDEFAGKKIDSCCLAKMPVKSGNVFYAMGAWCVTTGKKFYHEDPDTGAITMCGIKEMSWFAADCMMRMAVTTETYKYFKDIPSLRCFFGMEIGHLIERER